MTNANEELAKQLEAGHHGQYFDLDRCTAIAAALGIQRSSTSTRFERVEEALALYDVTAALAIKDALFPDSSMGMEFYKANKPQYTFAICIERDDPPLGESNTLSHAIMAALVRATDKKEGE